MSLRIKNNTSYLVLEHTEGIAEKVISSKDITQAVDTINNFPTGAHDGQVVIVRDLNRGGTFIYDSTKIVNSNDGTNFSGWIRQDSGAVNVKWFGAKGDGITDDTTALISAIASNGIVYVPFGTYKVTTDITIVIDITTDFVLTGDAPEASIIRFESGKGFIFNTPSSMSFSDGDKSSIIFRNIGVETKGNNVSTGVAINSLGGYGLDVNLENCRFSGDTNVTGWATAIYANNMVFSHFSNIVVQGNGTQGIGIHINGDEAKGNTDNFISSVKFHRLHTAVKLTGYLEGTYISQMVCVSNISYGIYWDSAVLRPLLTLVNSHINANICGVKLINVAQVIIDSSNLIYAANTVGVETFAVQCTASSTAVSATHKIDATIIGIGSRVGCNSTGVYIGDSVNRCVISSVIDNCNIGVQSALNVGTVITPKSSITNFDTMTTNMFAAGVAFNGTTALTNTISGYTLERNTSSTEYNRDLGKEQLRVGCYVYDVATANDTVSIPIGDPFRTDTLGGIVAFGSGSSVGSNVCMDLGLSTNDTLVAYVKGATIGTSVRLNYILYGY